MNYYSITKQEPIVVYGGGQIGISLARRLIQAGNNVVAILDRNPSGVKDSPIIVMEPGHYFEKNGDSFVFISLGNGLEHTTVAQKLKATGFERILFLPLFLRSLAAKNMVHAWNAFFCESFDVKIPSYDALWNVSLEDFIIYGDNTGFVIVIVHKDYVRTLTLNVNDNPFSSYILLKDPMHLKFMDIPIDNDYYDKNYKFKDDFTNFMNNALSFYNSDFFTCCAAPCTLNKKGYFNLIDGAHRCYFMVKNGFIGLPLRIKRSEWELFFNESKAQKLMDYCKNIESLPFKIKHSAFINFPVKERQADAKFLKLYNELCVV